MATLNSFYPTDDFDDVLDVWIRKLIGSTLRSEYKNVETLSADRDLENVDTPIQVLDADGGDWDVILPPPDAVENHPYNIRNNGASGTITVKSNDEATTHAVLNAGEFALLLPDGEGGYDVVGSADPANLISDDAGNALELGGDNKLFVSDAGGSGGAAAGGDTTPYRISVTVASNNITVALKNKDGDDPSVDSPVKVQIGDTVREVTSALSVTKNAGTNWCNSGSAELATKEVDYFAYLGYNATDGVVIGFSRIPFARIYSDFSTTTTNEKYAAISTITNAASSNAYAVIGRFAATLSAGAGYTWSVPTFTAANLVNSPIHTTRPLSYVPQFTNLTVGNGTLAAFYQVACERVYRVMQLTFGSTTSISGAVSYTLPFTVNSSVYSVTSANNAARFFDASPAGSYAGLSYIAANSVTLVAQNAAGTYLIVAGLSSTVPFTWTTSDAISDSGWIVI